MITYYACLYLVRELFLKWRKICSFKRVDICRIFSHLEDSITSYISSENHRVFHHVQCNSWMQSACQGQQDSSYFWQLGEFVRSSSLNNKIALCGTHWALQIGVNGFMQFSRLNLRFLWECSDILHSAKRTVVTSLMKSSVHMAKRLE